MVTIRITSLETKKKHKMNKSFKTEVQLINNTVLQGDSIVIQHSFLFALFCSFLAVLCFEMLRGAFSSCGEQGYPSRGCASFLRSDLSAAEHGLQGARLQEMWLPALEHRLAFGPSCSRACGFSHIRD